VWTWPESQPLVICPQGELAAIVAILPREVLAIEVSFDDERNLCWVDDSGRRIKVVAAPTMCIGFLTLSPDGAENLVRARHRLEDLGMFRPPRPAVIAHGADPVGLLLATALVDRLRAFAEHAQRLARELATFRATFETSQNAFAELEAYVHGLNARPLQLAFEAPPEAGAQVGGEHVRELRQILPVASSRVASLALHISADSESGLRIFLRSREDSVIRGRWVWAPGAVRVGWNSLRLERAISGPPRTLELVIQEHDSSAGLPALSLSHRQPLNDFVVAVAGEAPRPDRSLAMRIYNGLSGVSLPELPNDCPDGEIPVLRQFEVPRSIVKKIERATDNWRPDFAVVECLAEPVGIQCHPPPDGHVTVAALSCPFRSKIVSLSAVARVESPDSGPVEVAMAISSLSAHEVAARIESGDERVFDAEYSFSGWRLVRHGDPQFLQVDMAKSRGLLFFASRMFEGGSNWYAWTTFTEMKATLLVGEANEAAIVAEWAGPIVPSSPADQDGG